MVGPVVAGPPVQSRVLLVGQAPGPHEGAIGRPFAWTAGKRLFAWLGDLGLPEARARERLYFAAVARCFPGKASGGGDRVPDDAEIARCSSWLDAEIALLRPKLALLVGKLAIAQFLPVTKLDAVIGQVFPVERAGVRFEALPLPHPSGASTWTHTEPGRTLTAQALRLLERHPAFASLVEG